MKTKIRNRKQFKHKRRHMRVRNRVSGTTERPRVAVFRSNSHIYAQIIDDRARKTVLSVSSLKVDRSTLTTDDKKDKTSGKILQAREVGRLLAEAAKANGIKKIAFDRGGYLYHGRVAALADSARKHGLEF
jgi:large subunit ribosomal protein L18